MILLLLWNRFQRSLTLPHWERRKIYAELIAGSGYDFIIEH